MSFLAFQKEPAAVLLQLAIICPLVFLSGYVDAIAGGGGLISLPAYMFAGLPVHQAIATNKLSSVVGTAYTAWNFFKHGYMVKEFCLVAVPCGLVGAFAGSNLALVLSDRVLMIVILFILPVVGVYVFKTKNLSKNDNNPLPMRRALVLTAVVTLVGGVYDGFYGPGCATFMILLLTGLVHQRMTEAQGTVKAFNTATNITAFLVYLVNGQVVFVLGLVACVFGILGNRLGAKRFTRDGAKAVRPIILVVVVLFMVKLVHDLFFV